MIYTSNDIIEEPDAVIPHVRIYVGAAWATGRSTTTMAQRGSHMFQSFFKNRKIKKYAKKLPQDLKENYLYQKFYSKRQVDASIKRRSLGNIRGGVAVTDHCYAYAMYCSPEEFNEIHEGIGSTCDYESMRGDIFEIMFNSAADFTFSTLLVETSSSESSSFGGSGGSGSGDSGYSGGDGGGGGD
ncbi:MAG: hypothetical protein COA42_13380 [Alteromonadaceae bacterium]|nr:MAG: hypothetical protein COA42_13380 [Alteromonadaceae bacterium]